MGVTEKGRPSLALGISEFRRSKLFLDQLMLQINRSADGGLQSFFQCCQEGIQETPLHSFAYNRLI